MRKFEKVGCECFMVSTSIVCHRQSLKEGRRVPNRSPRATVLACFSNI